MRPWKYYRLRDQYARATQLASEQKPAEGDDMAKNRLEEIRIRPAKDGSHNVRHEYEAKPKLQKGSLTGGMMMDRPEPEEHNFGPKDGKAMMMHLAQALALKGALSGEEPEPGLSNAERG